MYVNCVKIKYYLINKRSSAYRKDPSRNIQTNVKNPQQEWVYERRPCMWIAL